MYYKLLAMRVQCHFGRSCAIIPSMKQEKIYVYGKHALLEALRNSPQTLKKVFLASQDDKELMGLLKKNNIPVGTLGEGGSAGDVKSDAKHQGIIGLLSLEKLVLPYEKFIGSLHISTDTSLVLMDELEDPQNVGAIIRSAAAMGVSGVLIPEHNQAQVSGAVVKVSAGMAFRIPLVQIGNINNVIRDLKERGFWIYGLDGNAKHSLNEEQFEMPTVFVLGNESKGIREKTRDLCDIMMNIPMHPQCESMNVAASTAIALYAWSTKHPNALK